MSNKIAQTLRDALERLTWLEAQSMLRICMLHEEFDFYFAF